MIQFRCPSCSHRLEVKESAAGRRAHCPSCREVIRIPDASPSLEDGPAAPPELQPELPGQPTPTEPSVPVAGPSIEGPPAGEPVGEGALAPVPDEDELPPMAPGDEEGLPDEEAIPALSDELSDESDEPAAEEESPVPLRVASVGKGGQERPAPKPISKGFYLASIFGAPILAAAATVAAMVLAGSDAMPKFQPIVEQVQQGKPPDLAPLAEALGIALPILAAAGVLLLFAWLMGLVFTYKMWAAVRGPDVSPSPGLAVGLLFVPLVNIIWMFIVYGRWPKVYNRIAEERGIDKPRVSPALGILMCVFCLVACLGFINIVLVPLYIAKVSNGINALARA